MPIEKLTPTFSLDGERVRALEEIVPEAFEDGQINLDVLRELLGEQVEGDGRAAEHFGLFWPGKRAARRLASMPSKGALVPAPGEGVDEEATENIFIEGDNLEALKLLQKAYAGRVKMIYIDPPYNTGQDFVYKDDYSEPLESYLKKTGQMGEGGELLTTNTKADGRFHTNWLNMMYPRLRAAKNFLSEDGVIFVSIDDNEAHNLRHVMNELFGEGNYLSTLYVQVRYPDKTLVEDAEFHKMIEQVLVYGNSPSTSLNRPSSEYSFEKFVWRIVEKKAPSKTLELGGKKVEVFDVNSYAIVKDKPAVENLKEIWATGKILDGNSSGRFFRDHISQRITVDSLGTLYKVYGIGDDRYDYRYFTGPKRAGATKGKYYQGVPSRIADNPEVSQKTQPINNFYNFADAFGNCRHEGGVDFRSGKKPIEFIKTLLKLGSTSDGEDIIMDFFIGSGSTAHAVMDLNIEDEGNRRFIGVQMPEPTDNEEFANLAELGKERIRRSIRALQTNGSRKPLLEHNGKQDLGFIVFKLRASNFKAWQDYHGENLQELEDLFASFESPLVDGWKAEDVLTEVMLLEGFPLSSRHASAAEFKKNRVIRVESDFSQHRLFICLDKDISSDTIERVATLPERDVFICFDSALNDEAKLRLADVGNVRTL